MLITADAGKCIIKIVPRFMFRGPRFTLAPQLYPIVQSFIIVV